MTKDEIKRYCGMRSEGIYIKIGGYLRQSVELDIVQLAWRHPQGPINRRGTKDEVDG